VSEVFGRWRKRAEQQPGEAGPMITAVPFPSETAARQAAAGGSPAEINRLGIVLKVAGRADEAAEFFRQAAEAGNNDAKANLALYLMTHGQKEEAALWFRRAGGPLGESLADSLTRTPDNPPGP
jgi:TPR repeat protein